MIPTVAVDDAMASIIALTFLSRLARSALYSVLCFLFLCFSGNIIMIMIMIMCSIKLETGANEMSTSLIQLALAAT